MVLQLFPLIYHDSLEQDLHLDAEQNFLLELNRHQLALPVQPVLPLLRYLQLFEAAEFEFVFQLEQPEFWPGHLVFWHSQKKNAQHFRGFDAPRPFAIP